MNCDKLFFRHVLLPYFYLEKIAAEAHHLLSEVHDDETPSKRTLELRLNASETM